MNFGMAIAPWLFGILADVAGTNAAIWTGIGVSLVAAAVNAPLMCDALFGRTKEKPPPSKRALPHEDAEFVEQALKGEFVDPHTLYLFNMHRLKEGKSLIVPRVKPYSEEKDNMDSLYSHATETFKQRRDMGDRILTALQDPSNEKGTEEFCSLLNNAMYRNQEAAIEEATNDLGKWIGDYLEDTGYNPHTQSLVIKQMILSAFPPINRDKEYTPENMEEALLRTRQIFNQYLQLKENKERNWTWRQALGKGQSAVFYS